MNNDKHNKNSKPDDRSTLDDLAQRTRIEREVEASKRFKPEPQKEEPDEDDWSHLNHLN